MHSQVRCNAPGQIDVVLPLFLRQADVLGPPVGDAGLHRLLSGDGQLLSGERVVPRRQALDLTGLPKETKRANIGAAPVNAVNAVLRTHQQRQQQSPAFHVVLVKLSSSVALFRCAFNNNNKKKHRKSNLGVDFESVFHSKRFDYLLALQTFQNF